MSRLYSCSSDQTATSQNELCCKLLTLSIPFNLACLFSSLFKNVFLYTKGGIFHFGGNWNFESVYAVDQLLTIFYCYVIKLKLVADGKLCSKFGLTKLWNYDNLSMDVISLFFSANKNSHVLQFEISFDSDKIRCFAH